MKLKKVLVLGSGALKIGQAGEFDYSGSQALKALREEGIYSVLVNPNVATIQTSEGIADKVYFLPITPYFIEEIIKKERPDGIMLAWGGQTGLNVGTALYQNGVLEKYGVKVLGTSVKAIMNTEDRDLFVKELGKVDLKVPTSHACETLDEAVEIIESSSSFAEICRKLHEAQPLVDYIGGSGITRLEYWFDNKGEQKIYLIMEEESIFYFRFNGADIVYS